MERVIWYLVQSTVVHMLVQKHSYGVSFATSWCLWNDLEFSAEIIYMTTTKQVLAQFQQAGCQMNANLIHINTRKKQLLQSVWLLHKVVFTSRDWDMYKSRKLNHTQRHKSSTIQSMPTVKVSETSSMSQDIEIKVCKSRFDTVVV